VSPEAAQDGAIARAKAALRATVLAKRDALTPAYRARASEIIVSRIAAFDALASARVVMAYASFGSEVDTWPFIADVRRRGKTLVLPRVDRARGALALYAVRDPDSDLVANGWGIREPRTDACPRVEPHAIEFVLAPGLAFDARGARLGYGKAYYDKLLAECARDGAKPFTVAGAFDAQIVDDVPMEPHDVRIGVVVTETTRPRA
jgi:5-formyltetrahydrofolate cyclo-ligase